MEPIKPESMNERVLAAGAKVGGGAMALLQGYPFTGFAKFSQGAMEFAPAQQKLGVDWKLFWDIRVFGELGEEHFWKWHDGDWRCRFRKRGADFLKRQYPVWGTPTETIENGWTLFREERGTEVWIPSELVTRKRMVLEIDQVLGVSSEESGVVSVVDSMIRSLKASEEKEVL